MVAMRWLIEFIGVGERNKAGKVVRPNRKPNDVSINMIAGGKEIELDSPEAEILANVRKGCAQASAHPTQDTNHPRVDDAALDEALRIIVKHLERTVYSGRPRGLISETFKHGISNDRAEQVRFDLQLRDTELGWMRRFDKYALLGVPVWFNMIEWVALVGALELFRRKSGSMLLAVLVAVSIVAIWRYLVAVVGRIEFVGFAPKASARTQFWISEFIGGLITTGGYILVYRAVDLIAKFTSTS
jgi:hypothetical protein